MSGIHAATLLSIVLLSLRSGEAQNDFEIPSVAIAECRRNGLLFDITHLRCAVCRPNQQPSLDGQSCQCVNGYRLEYNKTSTPSFLACSACPSGIVSADGWSCVGCTGDSCTCSDPAFLGTALHFTGDVNLNEEQAATFQCFACASGTFARDGKCEPCGQKLSMAGGSTCACSQTIYDGLCFAPDEVDVPGSNIIYRLPGIQAEHSYMKDHLLAAYAMCGRYNNASACQILANMCTLQYSERLYVSNTNQQDACALLDRIGQNVANRPSLWTASSVLDSEYLFTRKRFSRNQLIDVVVAIYAMNGLLIDVKSVQNGVIQLCSDKTDWLNAAFQFGTSYYQQCSVDLGSLQLQMKNVFFEPYLKYRVGNGEFLFPIPVLPTQYRASDGSQPNNAPFSSRSSWQLAKRFFLVDDTPLIGTDAAGTRWTHYAARLTLNLRLADDKESFAAGSVYPPFFTVTYAYARSDESGTMMTSFGVNYQQNWAGYVSATLIAMAACIVVALLFAVLRTWSWSKRAGKISVDCVCMIKYIAYSCGYVANLLLVIAFIVSIILLLSFKLQSQVVLTPPGPLEGLIFSLLYSALVLKSVDVGHLIVMQCTTDVFFIDWEKSRREAPQQVTFVRPLTTSDGDAAPEGQRPPAAVGRGATAWRSTLIANEWCEMLCHRKVNVAVQMLLALLILDGIGVVNLASLDGDGYTGRPDTVYQPPDSRLFRFALVASVYIMVGAVQWAFTEFFYERLVNNTMGMFADLCSIANVSVFVMSQRLFGYYIHGRSASGYADVSLRELVVQLKKEELGLVGHRGLQAGSDTQVFTISIPPTLRRAVDRAYSQLSVAGGAAAASVANNSVLSEMQQKTFDTYYYLNELLQHFIDHEMSHIADYDIRQRTLVEDMLDVELAYSRANNGVFSPDPDGKIFEKVFFHGCEFTLFLFDLMLLCTMDSIMGSSSVAAAATITYLMTLLYSTIQSEFGRRNVAHKTLIDSAFLI